MASGHLLDLLQSHWHRPPEKHESTPTESPRVERPSTASPAALLDRLGNRTLGRLLKARAAHDGGGAAGAPPSIQTKLVVGAARDSYEEEADRVAAQVTGTHAASTPAPERSGPPTGAEGVLTQRKVATGEGALDLEGGTESHIAQHRGGGAPLPDETRAVMEPRIGASLSGVRVHTDTEADALNRSLQSRAFTTGRDIFFRNGEYSPGSSAGKQLLAHELTHVVQQGGGLPRGGANRRTPGGITAHPGMTIQRMYKNEFKGIFTGEVEVEPLSFPAAQLLWKLMTTCPHCKVIQQVQLEGCDVMQAEFSKCGKPFNVFPLSHSNYLEEFFSFVMGMGVGTNQGTAPGQLNMMKRNKKVMKVWKWMRLDDLIQSLKECDTEEEMEKALSMLSDAVFSGFKDVIRKVGKEKLKQIFPDT